MMKQNSILFPLPMLFVLAALALILAVAPADSIHAQSMQIQSIEISGVQEFTGRLIARPIQPDTWKGDGLDDLEAFAKAAQARKVMATLPMIEYVPQTDEYILALPTGETENTLAKALMATRLFQYVEPDWKVFPVGNPNDPLFGNQWHHAPNRMQSADGWSLHTGNPTVSVGICDTGIRTTHEDLQMHRLEGYNAVDKVWESKGGNIGPVHPHGTMTTGCAAANGNNSVGIAGVGWNLSHRMLRVSNSSGGGASLSTLQHAARTAVENGDRIASVSYSGVDNASNLTTATYIKSIGGLLVWAAGNDNRNLTYGNRDADDIIVAGGTDQNDNKAYFSAYGQFVDLTAPAVSVFTTDAGNNSDYAAVNGTSFATPLTAGLAALIWSYDPSLSPDDVEALLKQGCDDLGSNGVDNTFGYGRINVFDSLSLVGGGGNQDPVAVLTADKTGGVAPLTVLFDASGSFDPDGTIVSYEWDWEGDGTYDATTSLPTNQYIYTVADQYDATVRVTDDQGATDTDFVTITVTDPGGGPEQIAFDGFESKSFNGGTGWNGAWSVSGDAVIRWNKNGPHTGSGHVRLRRNSGLIERSVDLSGAANVHLAFWAKVNSFEKSDQAAVRVSPDGVNYTTVMVFTKDNSDNVYHPYDIDLSGFSMTPGFRIVFDANMSGRGDRFYVDDIEIIGEK